MFLIENPICIWPFSLPSASRRGVRLVTELECPVRVSSFNRIETAIDISELGNTFQDTQTLPLTRVCKTQNVCQPDKYFLFNGLAADTRNYACYVKWKQWNFLRRRHSKLLPVYTPHRRKFDRLNTCLKNLSSSTFSKHHLVFLQTQFKSKHLQHYLRFLENVFHCAGTEQLCPTEPN